MTSRLEATKIRPCFVHVRTLGFQILVEISKINWRLELAVAKKGTSLPPFWLRTVFLITYLNRPQLPCSKLALSTLAHSTFLYLPRGQSPPVKLHINCMHAVSHGVSRAAIIFSKGSPKQLRINYCPLQKRGFLRLHLDLWPISESLGLRTMVGRVGLLVGTWFCPSIHRQPPLLAEAAGCSS